MAYGTRVRPRLPARIDRLALVGSRAALAALTAGFGLAALLDATPSYSTQLAVYLVGMVGLNLPHGGYEHLSNLRNRGLAVSGRYVARYLLVAAGFVALLFAAPALGVALAFATATAKAGHGDLHALDALVGGAHLRTRGRRALAAVVRGGAVMLVPLLAWPGQFYAFGTYMAGIVGGSGLGVGSHAATVSTLVAVGYGAALLAHVALGLRAADGLDAAAVDVGETLLLVGYFLVVPAIVAIGLYFPLWYSLRQAGRAARVRRTAGEAGLGLPRAAGLTAAGGAVTLGLAAAFFRLVPAPFGGAGPLAGAVAFVTLFVCIIALPHVVVGQWIDDRGIWYVP